MAFLALSEVWDPGLRSPAAKTVPPLICPNTVGHMEHLQPFSEPVVAGLGKSPARLVGARTGGSRAGSSGLLRGAP